MGFVAGISTVSAENSTFISWSLPTVCRGYPTILHMNNGINSVFDELLSSFFWSIGSIVHRGIVGSRSIHRGIPVYSRQLFHLPLKDTRFYHRKTGPVYMEVGDQFRNLRKESKALIKRKLKEYHTSLGDSMKVNPKHFWSYFRHETKSNSIPANVTYGGRQISSGAEMAEVFNKYFYSTFTHAPEVPLDAFTPPYDRMPVLDSLVLCEDEVYKVLLNLDPSKAPGLDGLPTIVLKTCARELAPSL